MKKILITGNSGYIGSHLCQILKQREDFDIYCLDIQHPKINIKNFVNIDIQTFNNNSYADIEFDCVIHLAAKVSVGESVQDPALYYLTNTIGTYNVLNNIKTKNFVLASTGAADGMLSPYGISKKASEEIVHQHCKKNDIPFTIFRFYNVVGSDGISPTNPDGLFYNLINAIDSNEFKLFGDDYNTKDGSCIRDYVHVNEICAALIKAIDVYSENIENLGHGVGTSVKEMIEIFKRVNNCNFETVICPRREGDLEYSVLSNPSSYMSTLYTIDQLLKI